MSLGGVIGFNVLVSARPVQPSLYTGADMSGADFYENGGADLVAVGGTIASNYEFKDAAGAVDTAAPYQFEGPQARFELKNVPTNTTAIEILVRRTGETGWRPWGAPGDEWMVDTGGNIWKSVAAPTDFAITEYDTPAHGSSPWTDLEIVFKIMSAQGIFFQGPYDHTATHAVLP